MIERYYTPAEVAKILQLTPYTVRHLLMSKKIGRKVNSRIYVSESDLNNLLGVAPTKNEKGGDNGRR